MQGWATLEQHRVGTQHDITNPPVTLTNPPVVMHPTRHNISCSQAFWVAILEHSFYGLVPKKYLPRIFR